MPSTASVAATGRFRPASVRPAPAVRKINMDRAARAPRLSDTARIAVSRHFERVRQVNTSAARVAPAVAAPAAEVVSAAPAVPAPPAEAVPAAPAVSEPAAEAASAAPAAAAAPLPRPAAAPVQEAPAASPRKTLADAAATLHAKQLDKVLAAVLALLAVAGGIWWFVATTPGWHRNERTGTSYLIMEGTHRRAKGVYEFEGVRYVFDDRGLLVHGWGEHDGHTYYGDANGQLLTGVQSIDGEDYYLNETSGEFCSGFYDTEAGKIAFNEHGFPLRGVGYYQDIPYFFNAEGILQTGWIDDGEDRYFALEDGALQTGWQTLEDVTYYFVPETCALQRGVGLIDGKNYCFAADTGALQKNTFVTYDYGTYYAGAEGECAVGWQDIGGSRYYFDETGYMLTGYQTLSENLYFFDKSGALLTGFQRLDDILFYFGEDGVIKAGSYEYDGASRLFDAEGRALYGWQTLAETTYYFMEGVKQTGVVEVEGEQYNLGTDGILRTGWSGDSYYSDHGFALTGWQTIGNKLYYFNDSGIMARSTTIGQYKIDANGVATKQAVAGNSASSCYNYVRSNMRYARIGADTYDNMLNYAMTYHRGACYHYATFLNYVLNQAGISNSIIWGLNPQGGTHVWNQLSNGYILDACNGYYMYTPDQMRAMGFSW